MRLPQVIRPWRLIKRLGHGAFGAVYLAEVDGDAGFSSHVAVKLLDGSAIEANPTIGQSLIDEAKLLSRLRHPGIVRVLDLQRVSHEFLGDTYAMAMEYVEGITLSTLLDNVGLQASALSVPEVISLLAELTAALEYAHNHVDEDGVPSLIVHRDLKPANLIVTPEGHIKILDFGIAWASERSIDATREGMTKGTLPYMSPEQVHGMPVDARSDLYSLGTIVFEMLVGEPFVGFYPFGQTDIARMFKRVAELQFTDRADLLRDTLRKHPHFLTEPQCQGLEALLTKLLARNPADRFQDTGDLREELERLYVFWRPEAGRRGLGAHMDVWYTENPPARSPQTIRYEPPSPKADSGSGSEAPLDQSSHQSAAIPAGSNAETRVFETPSGPRNKMFERMPDSERFRKAMVGMILLGVLLFLVAPRQNSDQAPTPDEAVDKTSAAVAQTTGLRISDARLSGEKNSTEARTTLSFIDFRGEVVLAPVLSGLETKDGLALRRGADGWLDYALVGTRAYGTARGLLALWDLRGAEPRELWRLDDFFEETPELNIGVHGATAYGFGGVDFLPGEADPPHSLALAHDRNFAPAWLLRLDSTGAIVGRRYHPGHLDALFPLDAENLVVSGVNNRLCPTGKVPCEQEEIVWVVPPPSAAERTEFLPGCGGTPTFSSGRGYSWPKDLFRIRSVIPNARASGGFELILVRKASATKPECTARLGFGKTGEFREQFSECGFEAPIYEISADAGEICREWVRIADEMR